MSELPPPVRVNGLIKLARWSLLVAGIFYGATKHKALAYREIGIREEERKRRYIRNVQLAEERRQASERDIEMLSKLAK